MRVYIRVYKKKIKWKWKRVRSRNHFFFLNYLHVNEGCNHRGWFVAERSCGVLPLFEDYFLWRPLLLRRLILLRRRRGRRRRRSQRGEQRDRHVPLDGAVYLKRWGSVRLQAAGLAAGAARVGHGDGGACEIDGGERESERQ